MGMIGDILGIVGGVNQQNSANAAAAQDTAGENSALGAESGSINQILQNYFGQGGGSQALTSLLGSLGSGLGQLLSTGTSNSPYAASAANVASGLQNFNGLKPQELSALQTTLGNSGLSTINTLKSQMGNVGDQGAVISNALFNNNQNALNATTQLGSIGAQQELGAQQSAGNIYSGLQQNTTSQIGELLSGLLGATGQQTGLVGQGLSGLGSIGSIYGNSAQGAANTAQQAGQQIQSGFTGLGSGIAGLMSGTGSIFG